MANLAEKKLQLLDLMHDIERYELWAHTQELPVASAQLQIAAHAVGAAIQSVTEKQLHGNEQP